MITVTNIKPKDCIFHGQTITRKADGDFNADIEPGRSIRIYGTYQGREAFDRVFMMGDTVEYDSYNNSYTGPIIAIGKATVTVQSDKFSGRNTRLSLNEFIWRNYNLDLNRIARQWAQWMD